MRMSPMWLTSKTPTPPRTALCSAIRPPLDGYSTGISHPPKSTILAPSLRCSAFSGVLRSAVVVGEIADSIRLLRQEPILARTQTCVKEPPVQTEPRAVRLRVAIHAPAPPRFLPPAFPSCTVFTGGAYA